MDISPARLSFYSLEKEENPIKPQDTISESIEILEHYIEDLNIKVNRLGLLFIRMHRSNSPAKLIIERFCKPELQDTIFKKTASFDFRNHQIIKISDLDVNLVTSFKTGLIQVDGTETQEGVIIEQDVNTRVEEMGQRSFKIEDIKSYFQLAAEKVEASLKLNLSEEI